MIWLLFIAVIIINLFGTPRAPSCVVLNEYQRDAIKEGRLLSPKPCKY